MPPATTRRARTVRTTILRRPPPLPFGSAAAGGSFFSTLMGLLISVPSVSLGMVRGFWNQGPDLAGRPREVKSRLGLVGQRVDAQVAGGGERGLGVVDLDRGGHAGLEAVARQL